MANVLPKVHHEYCNYHIKGNMCAHYKKKKIQAIEELFWKVVNTYCTFNFDTDMRIIYRVNLDVTTYLAGITYNKWARAHFGMF